MHASNDHKWGKPGPIGHHDGTTMASRRHMSFRSKIIAAVIVSTALSYFLCLVNVAMRVHQLHDPEEEWRRQSSHTLTKTNFVNPKIDKTEGSKESDLRGDSKDTDTDDSSQETATTKPEREKQIEGSGTSAPDPHEEATKSDRAKEIDQVLKEQETAPKPSDKPKPRMRRPGFKPNPHGYMVAPEILFHEKEKNDQYNELTNQRETPQDQVLTAYLESIDRSTWKNKPLPTRMTKAVNLTKVPFSRLNSCSKLPEQWPVDEYPDADPFLPWIHDVFPTADGKFIQFVAQNKRRCHTGTTPDEEAILEHTEPQISLFQHVPLKKLESSSSDEPRFRLSSHEDADPDSINTRFLCRFKPSGDITFSEFNNDYEWTAVRKRQRVMFHEEGRDNSQIQTSQLIFRCPVPDHLVEKIKTGESVVNDWATIFVDVIPVRTPPRYGPPDRFLVPYYASSRQKKKDELFDPDAEWGKDHILPKIFDSGRWENIPVCKPSLMTYEPQALEGVQRDKKVKHNLVSCLWASTGYATRGNRYAINDGQRRLLEWITFNKIIGFDHFYIYDNSGAFTNQSSLQPIADKFPGDVTIVKWPSRVCNNNPNNVDSIGERSSQYAAETSCRLRFGSHVNWIGQFDIDEYLIPMGNYSSLVDLLHKLDEEGMKIINFASWRAWPRRTHINDPEETTYKKDRNMCGRNEDCFELSVRKNTTMMEAYNCDRQKPGQKTSTMPAEKQIYRADYVKQHFIHYSTVTESTKMRKEDFDKEFPGELTFPDPLSRFGDELNEGLMLHSKSIARQDTAGWKKNCNKDQDGFDQCRIGFPWPEDGSNSTSDKDGWEYNCYVNPRIDNYWAPKVKTKLREMGLMQRID